MRELLTVLVFALAVPSGARAGATPAGRAERVRATASSASTAAPSPAAVVEVKAFGCAADASKDATECLQRALNAASAGGAVVRFEPGARYLVTPGALMFAGDELTLDGNGATLVGADVVGTAPLLASRVTKVATGLVPAADVPAGADAVAFDPAALDPVRPGDVMLLSTRTANPRTGVRLGTLRRVTSTAGGRVTLDGVVTRGYALATDEVRVTFLRPITALTVRGLRFVLPPNSRQGGLAILYGVGVRVEDCSFDGGAGTSDTHYGLWVLHSFGTQVSRVVARHFRDPKMELGYGIYVSGHGAVVRDCDVEDCKHGITTGDNDYLCTNVTFERNRANDAMLDAHSSAHFVRMLGNTVEGVGRTAGPYAVGMWVRGRHQAIEGNTIVAAPAPAMPCDGIRALEDASDGVSITANRISGCSTGISADKVAAATRFRIAGNVIDATSGRPGFAAINLPRGLTASAVEGNLVDADQTGIQANGGQDVTVSRNVVSYGRAWPGNCIRLARSRSPSAGWVLEGNQCASRAQPGQPVVVEGDYGVAFGKRGRGPR